MVIPEATGLFRTVNKTQKISFWARNTMCDLQRYLMNKMVGEMPQLIPISKIK